jgi:hypothetical protein
MIIAIIIMEALGYVNFPSLQSFNSSEGIVGTILAVCVVVGTIYAIFSGVQSAQRSVKNTGGISTTVDSLLFIAAHNGFTTTNIMQHQRTTKSLTNEQNATEPYQEVASLLKQAIAVMEVASLADDPNTHKMRDLLKTVQGKS